MARAHLRFVPPTDVQRPATPEDGMIVRTPDNDQPFFTVHRDGIGIDDMPGEARRPEDYR